MSLTENLTSRIPNIPGRGSHGDVVSVVKLQGVINAQASPLARGVINMAGVESALKRAFEHDRLRAVALQINSPGGAPTQSGLIAERIRQLAAKHDVPVLAFAEDVAASGGYWLACAGDEIYAHRTSLVGSIGVVSGGFGFPALLERFGIERRLHTAGNNKARLDPFTPERSEDVEWLGKLHDTLHQQFISWVRERRADKLDAAATEGERLWDGDVWTGSRAAELGLVDGVGNLREVLTQRFPDAEVVFAEPKKPLLARLGVGAPGASLVEAFENRALWSRFGI